MHNRWLVGGLVVSLVLNLLLGGFVIGRLTSGAPYPAYRPDPTTGVYRLIGFLPEERRKELRSGIRDKVHDLYPGLRQIRKSHRRIDDALTADPFVREDLAAALAALRTQLDTTQVAAHTSFVDVASALTQQERQQLAEAMRRPPRNFGHHDRHDRGGVSRRGQTPP